MIVYKNLIAGTETITFDKTVIIREIYLSRPAATGDTIITFDSSGAVGFAAGWAWNRIRVFLSASISFRVANIRQECRAVTFTSTTAVQEASIFFDYK